MTSPEGTSQHDALYERFITGRSGYQTRHTNAAQLAFDEDRPVDVIVAVRKVLEVPDDLPGTPANPFHITPVASAALLMHSETRARLALLEYDARQQINNEPAVWLARVQGFHEERRFHDAGLCEQEAAKIYRETEDLDASTNLLGYSYTSLKEARFLLSPQTTDEDLIEAIELKRQRYGVLKESVEAFKAKPIKPRDLSRLRELTARMIETGYPASSSPDTYLRLMAQATKLGMEHSSRFSSHRRYFHTLGVAINYSIQMNRAMDRGQMVIIRREDNLGHTLHSNGARF